MGPFDLAESVRLCPPLGECTFASWQRLSLYNAVRECVAKTKPGAEFHD